MARKVRIKQEALGKLRMAEIHEESLSPEQLLWLMVLERGIRDVLLRRIDAVRWLLDDRVEVGSYRWICQLIGYNVADEIRQRLIKSVKGGQPLPHRFSAKFAAARIRTVSTTTSASHVPRGYA